MKATRSIVSAISRARHGDDRFLDELFEPIERADARRVGVDRGDAAGMAGVPGLQEIERLGPRTSPTMMRSGRSRRVERTRSEMPDDARPRAQRHGVRRGALQLARVLDQDDDALVDARAISASKRVGQGGLAELVPPAIEDVAAGRRRPGGGARPAAAAHDAVGDIVVEGESRLGGLADREAGPRATTGGSTPSNRSPVSPSPCGGSSAADDRRAGVDLGPDVAGDQPDDPLDLRRRQHARRCRRALRPADVRSAATPSGLTITSTTRGSAKRRLRWPAPWRCAASPCDDRRKCRAGHRVAPVHRRCCRRPAAIWRAT